MCYCNPMIKTPYCTSLLCQQELRFLKISAELEGLEKFKEEIRMLWIGLAHDIQMEVDCVPNSTRRTRLLAAVKIMDKALKQ